MADKKERSALGTLLAFAILVGLLIWMGMIFSSHGEKRLEQACKPIEHATNFLHELATSIMGHQPTWTLYVQQYMMNGCSYTFSVILAEASKPTEAGGNVSTTQQDPATGGIHN
jgi:hypothetical protein